MKAIGGAGRNWLGKTTKSITVAGKQLRIVLLPSIREVDEVIHCREEIVVAGLCNWWVRGYVICSAISILTEKTPAQLGCNAFGVPSD